MKCAPCCIVEGCNKLCCTGSSHLAECHAGACFQNGVTILVRIYYLNRWILTMAGPWWQHCKHWHWYNCLLLSLLLWCYADKQFYLKRELKLLFVCLSQTSLLYGNRKTNGTEKPKMVFMLILFPSKWHDIFSPKGHKSGCIWFELWNAVYS